MQYGPGFSFLMRSTKLSEATVSVQRAAYSLYPLFKCVSEWIRCSPWGFGWYPHLASPATLPGTHAGWPAPHRHRVGSRPISHFSEMIFLVMTWMYLLLANQIILTYMQYMRLTSLAILIEEYFLCHIFSLTIVICFHISFSGCGSTGRSELIIGYFLWYMSGNVQFSCLDLLRC